MQRRIEQLREHFSDVRLRARRAAGGARFPARRASRSSSSTSTSRRSTRPLRKAISASAATPPTTRRCAGPGIERARGLVTCVNSDADNIFVTLSARALRADLFIVARGNNDDAAPKLRRAGADRVVSPYSIGGRQMAMLATRPAAVEFVDRVLGRADIDLLLEDLTLRTGRGWSGGRSARSGRTLRPAC